MKKFRFKYAKILQLRIDKENEVKNSLAKINQKIVREEGVLEDLLAKEHAFQVSVEAQMLEGVSIGTLRDNAHNTSYLKAAVDKSRHLIRTYMDERVAIQKDLIEANKERKVMEKLKEKEVEAYKVLEEFEEKQLIDQIVTYQSTQKKG